MFLDCILFLSPGTPKAATPADDIAGVHQLVLALVGTSEGLREGQLVLVAGDRESVG